MKTRSLLGVLLLLATVTLIGCSNPDKKNPADLAPDVSWPIAGPTVVPGSTATSTPTTVPTVGPGTPVPTVVPTTPPTVVPTPVPTAVPTPVTNTWHLEFTAPANTSFEAWTGKFAGAPSAVTRQPYNVPAGGVWQSLDVVVGATETGHDELLCTSSSGTIQRYKNGSVFGLPIALPAGTTYTFNY